MHEEDIAYFINWNRRMQGLSMVKLASMAGVAVSTLSRIESGESDPTVETFAKILYAMNFEININARGIGVKNQDLFKLVLDKET